MEQLVLDPPESGLRLVVSHQQPCRDDRYRNAGELGVGPRRLYRAVLERALAEPPGSAMRRLDPDALRVTLAARQARQAGPAHRFTTDDVWRLMMVDLVAWCHARRLEVPDGCPVALMFLWQVLDEVALFHPDSDSRDDLMFALEECTGGCY